MKTDTFEYITALEAKVAIDMRVRANDGSIVALVVVLLQQVNLIPKRFCRVGVVMFVVCRLDR